MKNEKQYVCSFGKSTADGDPNMPGTYGYMSAANSAIMILIL